MSTPSPPYSTTTGRRAAWLGVLLAIAGVAVYAALFLGAGRLHLPWYALIASVAGFLLLGYSLTQRRSVWRILGLLFVGFLIFAEGWFLFFFTPNPPYAGPLVPGQPFPAFTAQLSNGQPFNQEDLNGKQDTVLVFYRGHW